MDSAKHKTQGSCVTQSITQYKCQWSCLPLNCLAGRTSNHHPPFSLSCLGHGRGLTYLQELTAGYQVSNHPEI